MLAATLPSRQDETHHRIDYLGAGAAGGRAHRARPDVHPGRDRLRLGLAADHRARRPRGRPDRGLRAGRAARRRAGAAAAAVPQPRVLRHQRHRPGGRLCPVRLGHLPAAVPPGRARRQPHRLGPADPAADGRPAHHLDRLGSAHQPHRPLQTVPDRRHRDHGGAGCSCSPRWTAHTSRATASAFMFVLGLGLGLGDAGARAGGPERRRLQGPRRGHLGRDPVSLDRRLGRDRRARLDLLQPAGRRAGLDAAAPRRRRLARHRREPQHRGAQEAARRRSTTPTSPPSPTPCRTVFIVAACVAAVAFLLSWLLEQRPLRETRRRQHRDRRVLRRAQAHRLAGRGVARA